MSESNGKPGWIDPEYFENRPKFPSEELVQYKDKYIAWSYDGTGIVDSDADVTKLYDRLEENGFDLARTVIGFVEYSDISRI